MRICYIGASAPRLYNLMRFMRDQGHDVHWIALSYPTFEISKIRIHQDLSLYDIKYYKRHLLAPYYLMLFRKKIKQISPDILHAINIKWAGWFSAFCGLKNVIVTPQGSDVMLRPELKNDIIHKLLRKHTIKNADIVTYGNKAMLRDIHFWAQPKKSYKYFAGVDFNVMDFNIDSFENKKKMGIEGRKLVLSPRTFESNSNIDEIIKTIPIVKKTFSDVLYIFVRHLQNKNYTSKIMAKIEKLNIKENCMFFGIIKPEEMADYYSIADVVISIVSSDGMPATLFEAMAMKKIMVLSTIPSYVELMDEKYALMVNQNDSNEIAEAIIEGLTETEEVARIREIAHKWAWKNANIQKLNTKLEQLYLEMANSR